MQPVAYLILSALWCFPKIKIYHQHLKKRIVPGIIFKISNPGSRVSYHSEWTLAVQLKPWRLYEKAIKNGRSRKGKTVGTMKRSVVAGC